MGTDRDWEKWGATDPYFGVYSDGKFRRDLLNEKSKAEFFESGEQHIERILAEIHARFPSGAKPTTALDFGCGVGRLVIPLARRMQEVTGVDISPSMISEARRNCEHAGVGNVRFVSSDDALSEVESGFDLVHSHIVLQHIPWRRGRTLIQSMASRVNPGGFLVVQVLANCDQPWLVRKLVQLRYVFPPTNWLRNLIRGRPLREPAMQLHLYDMDVISTDLRSHGFRIELVDEPWPGTGFTGAIIVGWKK